MGLSAIEDLHAQALIKPFDISNADESVDSAGLRVIQTHETKLNRFGKAAITGLSDLTQETERVSRVQGGAYSFSGDLFDNTVHRPTRAALPINSTEAHFARPGFGTNFTTFSASHEGNDPTPALSRAADGTGSEAKQGILAPGLVRASIGTATPADEIHPLADGGYAVTSAGTGATLVSDQIVFGWEQRTGDFDQKVRVESLAPGGIWSQAGLMVRETLDPGSRFAASFATPSLNGSYFASRDEGVTGSP